MTELSNPEDLMRQLSKNVGDGFTPVFGGMYPDKTGFEPEYNTDFVLDLANKTLTITENKLTNADNMRYFKVSAVSKGEVSVQITDFSNPTVLSLADLDLSDGCITVNVDGSINPSSQEAGRQNICYAFQMSGNNATVNKNNLFVVGVPTLAYIDQNGDEQNVTAGGTVTLPGVSVGTTLEVPLVISTASGVAEVLSITAASGGTISKSPVDLDRFRVAPTGSNRQHALAIDTSAAGTINATLSIVHTGTGSPFTATFQVVVA